MNTALLIKALKGFEIGLDYCFDKTSDGYNNYKVYDNEGVAHKFTKEKFQEYFITNESEE